MNIGFYLIVFTHTSQIGANTGWGKWEFFVFLATTWVINSLVQAFFMPNCQEFSELIRTGGLDFALLKPIDTQFLISFQKVEWSSLSNLLMGTVLLVISLPLYLFYIGCGVAIMYSVMISLSATSIWLGRNQTLYNFWFYITNFSRYPMEIYYRGWGVLLYVLFTFIIPVLVVVNVPARVLAKPLTPRADWEWWLAGFAVIAALMSLTASRWVFTQALKSYRSASS